MLGLGMQELLVILIILLLLFGSSRLPEIGKGVGKAIRNFKKGISDQDEIDVTPKKPEVTDTDKEEKQEAKKD